METIAKLGIAAILLLILNMGLQYMKKVDTMMETHQTCTDELGSRYIAVECK